MSRREHGGRDPDREKGSPYVPVEKDPLPVSEVAEPSAAYVVEPSPRVPVSMPTQVARRIQRRLDQLESEYAAVGRSLRELGSAEELADRMIASVPSPSPWRELGPFFTTSRVARLLGGISRQAVADRRARQTLLALKTADGAWVYPEFQFDRDSAVLAGLPEILRILRGSGVDEWTLASWLTSRSRALEGRSPIDWLRAARDRGPLIDVARDAARRFAQ